MAADNALTQVLYLRVMQEVYLLQRQIYGKVFRDDYMTQLSKDYPEYGFEKNAGYGTKQHLLAIDDIGIMKEHRKSFEPIKSLL